MSYRWLIFLLSLLCLIGCSNKVRYYKVYLNGSNKLMHKALSKHAENEQVEIKRSFILDSFAFVRSNYFLDVLKVSTQRNKSLYDKYMLIPRNKNVKLAHLERFGRPNHFKSPKKTNYPAIASDSCLKDLSFKSEIIGHRYEKRCFEIRQDSMLLVSNLLEEMYDETGLMLPYGLLEQYVNTPSDKAQLFACKHSSVGISTLVLIREEKQSKLLWSYEFVFLNLLDLAIP